LILDSRLTRVFLSADDGGTLLAPSFARRHVLRLIAAQTGAAFISAPAPRAQALVADAPDLRSPTVNTPALRRSSLRTDDGVTLSILSTDAGGASAATPIVFVPGWGMPASIWSVQLAAFADSRTCIALDPRGQGESEAPSFGYTIDRRAEDLRDVLARLDRVVLVAWSLAVLESLHYVQRFGADRLAALVLVDNSVGEPPAPTPSDFLKRLREDRAGTVDKFVRGMFTMSPPEELIETLKRSALKVALADSAALLSYPQPREYWRAAARAFAKPLAYLVTPRFAAQAESLRANRPATRVEVFEHASHALFVDQPRRFNSTLAEFCDGLAPA